MRWRARGILLLAAVVGCDSTTQVFVDRCDESARTGELRMVIDPPPGVFGVGATVLAGDTLVLVATVRRVTGSSLDFWDTGTCQELYGEPLPASIEWRSSNSNVAVVTQRGGVIGRTAGTATITARAPTLHVEATREIEVLR